MPATIEEKVFENKTAWFSSSCDKQASQLWVSHAGQLAHHDFAQFLFSESWDCPDTNPLMQTEDYQQQRLALFQCQYVFDVVDRGIDSVVLGHYFLVLDECKKKMTVSEAISQPKKSPVQYEANPEMCSEDEIPDVKSFPKYVGHLSSITPGKDCVSFYLEPNS